MKKFYVNSLKRSNALTLDIKKLIPEMNIRRRMSRVVKMGVTTGLESILEFERSLPVDAIITSTSLGAIADSEKFLSNIIENEERMLNPTPFIQSTFNTVGAQIALISKKQCYNNTFVHRNNSFESGLLEATLRLGNSSSEAVLIGHFDESTPTVENIHRRAGVLGDKGMGEGAIFFVLTSKPLGSSVAEIELLLDDKNRDGLRLSQIASSYWSGVFVRCVADAIESRRNCTIINDYNSCYYSALKVSVL